MWMLLSYCELFASLLGQCVSWKAASALCCLCPPCTLCILSLVVPLPEEERWGTKRVPFWAFVFRRSPGSPWAAAPFLDWQGAV